MHVRPHNPKLDLAIGRTRRRHRSGPSQGISLRTFGVLASFLVVGPMGALLIRSWMPAHLTWMVDCAIVVLGISLFLGIFVYGRHLNNTELGWAKRERKLSAKRARLGKLVARRNKAPRSIAERAAGRVHQRESVVVGDVRTWQRQRVPYLRILVLLVGLLTLGVIMMRSMSHLLPGGHAESGRDALLATVVFVIGMVVGLHLIQRVFDPGARRSRRCAASTEAFVQARDKVDL